jgi:group I intron endonuclease
MMFIYVITCYINGKKYVGYDTGPVGELRRWNFHLSAAKQQKPPGHRSKLYPAMIKHGVDNFSVEVVVTAEDNSALKLLEKKWIKDLDSITNGYNIRDGGQGFSNLSSLTSDEAQKQLEAVKRGSRNANAKRWAGKTKEEKRDELKNAVAAYSSEARSVALKAIWSDPIKRAERAASMKGKKKNRRSNVA